MVQTRQCFSQCIRLLSTEIRNLSFKIEPNRNEKEPWDVSVLTIVIAHEDKRKHFYIICLMCISVFAINGTEKHVSVQLRGGDIHDLVIKKHDNFG